MLKTGILVPDSQRENGTMRQLDDTHERLLLLPTDATGSTVAGGQAYLADIARRLAPYFGRSQSRDRVLAYLRGLLSEADRKNSWEVAENMEEAKPFASPTLPRPAPRAANGVPDV